MNNTNISCLVQMVFDITYICLLHTLYLLFQYTQSCLYTSVRDYTSLSVHSLVVCEQLPRPTLKQFGTLSRAVLGYPIKPTSAWLCEHEEVPCMMAQACPYVWDELSLQQGGPPHSAQAWLYVVRLSDTLNHDPVH